jgi:hypothetical protein
VIAGSARGTMSGTAASAELLIMGWWSGEAAVVIVGRARGTM